MNAGVFTFLLGSFFIVGCASLNSHQTGRTLGKENSQVMASYNFGQVDADHYQWTKDSTLALGSVGGFYGLRDNLDIGILINWSTHVTLLGKYQFLGNRESIFASSIGVDVGLAPLGFISLTGTTYSGSLSLYNSIHPTDYLSLAFSPRWTSFGAGSVQIEGGFSNYNLYGYSAMITVGKRHQFSLEMSNYATNKNLELRIPNVYSIAYIFRLK